MIDNLPLYREPLRHLLVRLSRVPFTDGSVALSAVADTVRAFISTDGALLETMFESAWPASTGRIARRYVLLI